MKDLNQIKEELQAFVDACGDKITVKGNTLTEFFKSINSVIYWYREYQDRAKKFNDIFNNELVIENGVLLSNCSNDTTIIIPKGVVTISDRAFANCRNLESVVIPDSVIIIDKNSF